MKVRGKIDDLISLYHKKPYLWLRKSKEMHKTTLQSYANHNAFGMLQPNRHYTLAEEYKFGFGGQMRDDEIKGEGNSINYKYRMHDPRLGRFFAVDPLTHDYPELTPYQFSSLNPIWLKEIEGLEGQPYTLKTDESGNPTGTTTALDGTFTDPSYLGLNNFQSSLSNPFSTNNLTNSTFNATNIITPIMSFGANSLNDMSSSGYWAAKTKTKGIQLYNTKTFTQNPYVSKAADDIIPSTVKGLKIGSMALTTFSLYNDFQNCINATTASQKSEANTELTKNATFTVVSYFYPLVGLSLSTFDNLIDDPKTQLIYKADLEKRMNEGDYNAWKIYNRLYRTPPNQVNATMQADY